MNDQNLEGDCLKMDSKDAIKEMIESRNKIDALLNDYCSKEGSKDKSNLSKQGVSKSESLEKILAHLAESCSTKEYLKVSFMYIFKKINS